MMRIEVELGYQAYNEFAEQCALFHEVEVEKDEDLYRKEVMLPLGDVSVLVYGPWLIKEKKLE